MMQRDHWAAAHLDQLLDQLERVFVVRVQLDHRDLRIVLGDRLRSVGWGGRARDDLVAERAQDRGDVVERPFVLVRNEHAKPAIEVLEE
jgi:hypothetical protein